MLQRSRSLFIALFACGSASASTSGTTAMTYNVLFDATDVSRTIELIQKESPDILCLQELTPDFVNRFEKQLGQVYPHRVFYPAAGTWGIGIASVHPLQNGRRFPQTPHRMPGVEARVRIGAGSVLVSCIHLFPPGAKRRPSSQWTALKENAELRVEQARSLVKRYAGEKGPVLLLGDMNEEGSDAGMKEFAGAGYVNACNSADSDCGNTWPAATSVWPSLFEVDQIWGRGVSFRRTQRIKGGGSDHYPVKTSFVVVPKR